MVDSPRGITLEAVPWHPLHTLKWCAHINMHTLAHKDILSSADGWGCGKAKGAMWLSERHKKSVHVIKSHRRDWPQGGCKFGLSGRHRNYSQIGRNESQEEESAGRQKAGKAQGQRDLWRDRRGHKGELSPCWEQGVLELFQWPEVRGHAWWGREEGMKGEKVHPETLPSLPWMVGSFCPKLWHFWTHLFLAGNCVNVYPNLLSLCMCIHTHAHVCMYDHGYIWSSQSSRLNVFSVTFYYHFERFLTEAWAHWLARQNDQWDPWRASCRCLQALELQVCVSMPDFLHSAGDLNLGSQSYTALPSLF